MATALTFVVTAGRSYEQTRVVFAISVCTRNQSKEKSPLPADRTTVGSPVPMHHGCPVLRRVTREARPEALWPIFALTRIAGDISLEEQVRGSVRVRFLLILSGLRCLSPVPRQLAGRPRRPSNSGQDSYCSLRESIHGASARCSCRPTAPGLFRRLSW